VAPLTAEQRKVTAAGGRRKVTAVRAKEEREAGGIPESTETTPPAKFGTFPSSLPPLAVGQSCAKS
jgi:hypothetical protein